MARTTSRPSGASSSSASSTPALPVGARFEAINLHGIEKGSDTVGRCPGLVRSARFVTTNAGGAAGTVDAHRIILTREWGTYQRPVAVIGVNPSMADNLKDDPTINALYQHCEHWDRERLIMLNLFTLVATEPADMRAHPYPECGGSIEAWEETFDPAHRDPNLIVVAAWGKNGTHRDQDRRAMKWLSYWGIEPKCLGINKDGTPVHPLYVRRGTPLVTYYGRP